jgi:hypothetical protein
MRHWPAHFAPLQTVPPTRKVGTGWLSALRRCARQREIAPTLDSSISAWRETGISALQKVHVTDGKAAIADNLTVGMSIADETIVIASE